MLFGTRAVVFLAWMRLISGHTACVFTRPVVQNDYQYSRDRKGIPGWPNITRHACAPIVEDNRIVAIVGVGDKEACYDEMDTTQMTLFAGSMWTLLQRQRAETELRILNAELDKRVQQATAELRLLLDSTAEAICGLNLKGDCTFCTTPPSCELSGTMAHTG